MKPQLMKLAQASVFVLLLAAPCQAAVLSEDFSSDPASRGWRVFGDSLAFGWDSTNGWLEVTWDSTKPNNGFYHPLGTVLAKDDDFSLSFDVRLRDIASGVVAGKTGPFEIAIGFLRLADATNAAFRRGTGFDSPNLVEFDYFTSGYYDIPEWGGYFAVTPTVSPTMISRSNEFATGFTTPLELVTNQWFHVTLSYTASNQTLVTTLLTNGYPFAPVTNATLTGAFSDFRVDAISVTSYSGAGNDYDSVLAHGMVDNLVVTAPDPPRLSGAFSNGSWTVQLTGRDTWLYTLERTTNWTFWESVSEPVSGSGQILQLQDTHVPEPAAFYRVRAERP